MVLITVKEACDILGLHERTIRQWLATDKLPFVRLGDGKLPPIRIRKRDVLALIRPGGHAQAPAIPPTAQPA